MNKMLRVDFGFGTELRADGTPVEELLARRGIINIRETAVLLFGGCTLTRTEGDWRDDATGSVYSERGATLAVLLDSDLVSRESDIADLANEIKVQLHQKAVYVTRYEVRSKLY